MISLGKQVIIVLALAVAVSSRQAMLLRVCSEVDNHMLTLACLAVYVHPNWALTKLECTDKISKQADAIYLVGGNQNMDCKQGERRYLRTTTDIKLIKGNDLALIKIVKPFERVPVMELAMDVDDLKLCYTYCTWRLIRWTGQVEPDLLLDASLSEVMAVCGQRLIQKYKVVVEPCPEEDHHRHRTAPLCMQNADSHPINHMSNLHWFPAIYNSPLVCDNRLVGFFHEGYHTPSFCVVHDAGDAIQKIIKDNPVK